MFVSQLVFSVIVVSKAKKTNKQTKQLYIFAQTEGVNIKQISLFTFNILTIYYLSGCKGDSYCFSPIDADYDLIYDMI